MQPYIMAYKILEAVTTSPGVPDPVARLKSRVHFILYSNKIVGMDLLVPD